jgi:tetratricopeptide (TPR) repeat protein
MIWLLAALLLLPCARISAAPQPTEAEILLTQGDQYAAEGKLLQARQSYEKAIALGMNVEKDFARSHRLGLWYMNAEPHDYVKAAHWFEAALAIHGDDEIRLTLAQVLSWAGQFDPAIEQYRQLVLSKPSDNNLKRQLARVLSWSKRFPESLALYDRLKADSPNDIELLIERARVLSWNGQYSQAAQAYGEVLKNAPSNRDARFGEAQVLYWSGRLDPALEITRQLLNENPEDANASFLMAAMEHNRGQDASALKWLQHAAQDKDTKALRNLIIRDMRPTLNLRYGFENDREDPTTGMSTTYRTLRYTSTLGFGVTKNVGMEVTNIVTQNDTSTAGLSQLGKDSLAIQTTARLRFSLKPWLRLSTGAGEGSAGAGEYAGSTAIRRHHLLYDFHATLSHAGLRIDFTSARNICDYTPLAVHEDLLQRRETLSAGYTFGKRLRIGGEYWRSNYTGTMPGLETFTTHSQGGSANLVPILYSSERWAVEAGVRYDLFQFADGTSAILDPMQGLGSTGVFMPRFYQRYAGMAHLRWSPKGWLRVDLDGTYGPQRVFGFASLNPPIAEFGDTGSFGTQVTIPGGRVEPYLSYDYFATDTPASPGLQNGAYGSNVFAAGLRIRF